MISTHRAETCPPGFYKSIDREGLVAGQEAAAYTPGMPNLLAAESSPYLRQHADNPVEWWPWTQEAFAEARRANKPVFVSIG